MPLTPKGKKIMSAMKHDYGPKKGEKVFYASQNKGTITGVEKRFQGKGTRARLETAASKMFFGRRSSD